MKHILIILIVLTPVLLNGQTRINGNFAFETDPAKKYSLYIPADYNADTPNKVMLALHPFNTSRWDGESWCDTLVNFAAENQLILICPDGGADGQIDDPIDTAFTSALIDSVAIWYNLNFEKFYGIGFSWGSRGLYTYGLSHPGLIKGYIPVGAAISGTAEVNETLQLNAMGIPFYIVHGSLDSPTSRFYPIRDSLIAKGGVVETNLLAGIGHTIDFPDRNAILNVAFTWIDSVNCEPLSLAVEMVTKRFQIYPNPIRSDELLIVNLNDLEEGDYEVEVLTLEGKQIYKEKTHLFSGENELSLKIPKGTYIVQIGNATFLQKQQIIVQ